MFDEDSIKKAIAEALNTDIVIPSGHRAAIVTYVTQDEVKIATGIKMNDKWQIDFIASHSWVGDNQVGVISKITW